MNLLTWYLREKCVSYYIIFLVAFCTYPVGTHKKIFTGSVTSSAV